MSRTESVSHFGVFWDIENCPIPNGKHASNIVNYIRSFIKNKYNNYTECVFCCSCDTRRLDQQMVEGLNRIGVDILHVNPARPPYKVDADSKLKEGIHKFIDHHNQNSVIFVISGDVDFAPAIRSANRNGIQLILIYSQNASHDLRSLATESFCLNDIIIRGERSLSLGNNFLNNNNVVTTSRLPQIPPVLVPNVMQAMPQLVNIQSPTARAITSRPTVESQTSPQSRGQRDLLTDDFHDVNELIERRMNSHLSPRESNIRSIQESNPTQEQQSRAAQNRNHSDSEHFSPEFLEKVKMIESIAQMEREAAIYLLQANNGNIELAFNSLFES